MKLFSVTRLRSDDQISIFRTYVKIAVTRYIPYTNNPGTICNNILMYASNVIPLFGQKFKRRMNVSL
jgi:hypothetical protein